MKREDDNDFTYKRAIFPYVLDLMQKFELCYPVKEGREYLVPELMSIQQPELPKLEGPILRFYFEYKNILPRSILPRFIVRTHEDIYDGMHWRTGVVLSPAMYDSIAVIICDVKAKKITIELSGQNRREHFYLIRNIFHSLHASFEQLDVAEWIPLPDVDMAIEYEELVGYENNNINDYFVGKLGKKYSVAELLNGVEIPSARNDIFQWEAFLCHSSADKIIVRRIARKMKSLNIKYWLDEEQILPGDNIIDKITEGIINSRYITPCFSRNQLTSGWCKKEYQSILTRIISGSTKQKVTPLILDDLLDDELPLFIGDIRCERYKVKDQYNRLLKYLTP